MSLEAWAVGQREFLESLPAGGVPERPVFCTWSTSRDGGRWVTALLLVASVFFRGSFVPESVTIATVFDAEGGERLIQFQVRPELIGGLSGSSPGILIGVPRPNGHVLLRLPNHDVPPIWPPN